jgi:hypothetical protein
MSVPYPVRKTCPTCGRPMKAVADEAREGLRYVCTNCDHDPLHDPTARKWAESPLRPTENERTPSTAAAAHLVAKLRPRAEPRDRQSPPPWAAPAQGAGMPRRDQKAQIIDIGLEFHVRGVPFDRPAQETEGANLVMFRKPNVA